jgi:hypothetical protein
MLEYAATLDPKCKPTALVKKGGTAGAAAGKKEESWRDLPVAKRLEYALVKVRIHVVVGLLMSASVADLAAICVASFWHAFPEPLAT